MQKHSVTWFVTLLHHRFDGVIMVPMKLMMGGLQLPASSRVTNHGEVTPVAAHPSKDGEPMYVGCHFDYDSIHCAETRWDLDAVLKRYSCMYMFLTDKDEGQLPQ